MQLTQEHIERYIGQMVINQWQMQLQLDNAMTELRKAHEELKKLKETREVQP